ncbi:MAG: MATE family efflux transporter [Christensenellaceae bacterium]|nr:MATE family efflux transporter [Christensenellaceae bacterium]MEA5064909.1 MATE family efflux transporter [Eubacteriales bacterium]MEA5067462.1 MATE family efflux transporter [Christensenellaceae bacterium]
MDARHERYDLTRGNIFRKLVLVAVPIMGTQFMQMAYNLTDMFWLGRMEASTMAVAASGMGGMFLWLSQAFLLFGRMGAEIGVSQNLGRGDRRAALSYAEHAATIALLLGVAFGLALSLFAGPMIGLFNIQEADVRANAAVYMRITGLGIPLTFLSAAITGSFNGAGRSQLSFWANAVGLAVNMALDPLMILTFGWGVAGAAWATIIAQGVVCLGFVILSQHKKTRVFEHFRLWVCLKRDVAGQIMRWGVPMALESGAFTLLAMAVTDLNATFGQEALAVQKIGSQIESLSWLIGGGFGSAVTAFVGQNYGAQKPDRIREGVRISALTMVAWGLIVTALLYFFGRALFSLFSPDAQVLTLGESYLKLLAIAQLPMCLEAGYAGAFRGVGKTLPPSLSSIVSNVLRVPLVYALVDAGLGLWGIWLGVVITSTLRSLAVTVWYAADARRFK